jgi:hypothetical protein
VNLVLALPGLGEEADRLRNAATRPASGHFGMSIFGWMVMGSILRKQDSGGVQFDQRDLRIAHRASRVADGALALLVVWLVVALMALPDQSRTWLRPLIAANVLVGVLVVRALVESICTLWGYRREHA